MVIPRSRSAFSLSRTHAYLNEPASTHGAASACCAVKRRRPARLDRRHSETIGGGWTSGRREKYGREELATHPCRARQPPSRCRTEGKQSQDELDRGGTSDEREADAQLLDGTLVDTTALVDEVAGGGRLAGVDVAYERESAKRREWRERGQGQLARGCAGPRRVKLDAPITTTLTCPYSEKPWTRTGEARRRRGRRRGRVGGGRLTRATKARRTGSGSASLPGTCRARLAAGRAHLFLAAGRRGGVARQKSVLAR